MKTFNNMTDIFAKMSFKFMPELIPKKLTHNFLAVKIFVVTLFSFFTLTASAVPVNFNWTFTDFESNPNSIMLFFNPDVIGGEVFLWTANGTPRQVLLSSESRNSKDSYSGRFKQEQGNTGSEIYDYELRISVNGSFQQYQEWLKRPDFRNTFANDTQLTGPCSDDSKGFLEIEVFAGPELPEGEESITFGYCLK